MKKQTFIGGVVVLFIGSVLAKVLGAIFRIPLTWVLGAEGLGLYQLIFPLFSLLLVMSSTGAPTAIAKMVALRVSQNNYEGAKKVLKASILLLGAAGLLLGLILFALSYYIALLQGNTNAMFGYMAIAPSVFFVSILSAFRGYFQGYSNMLPTALSQVMEQAGKLIFGLIFGYLFIGYGVQYGAMGAILGVTISEIIAVLFMLGCYIKYRKGLYNYSQNMVKRHNVDIYNTKADAMETQLTVNSLATTINPDSLQVLPDLTKNSTKERKLNKNINTENKSVMRELIGTALPIITATVTLPFLLVIDSFLVVNLLGLSGFNANEGTALWGINSGVVNSLINMPIVLAQSVAISIVPAVAVSNLMGNRGKIAQANLICLYFCLPIMLGFMLVGTPLIQCLYMDSLGGGSGIDLAANLLVQSSVIIPLGAVLQVQNSSLQGMGFGKIPMINLLVAGLLKIGLVVLLVPLPSINIYGCVVSNIVFYGVALILNKIYLAKKLEYKFPVRKLLPCFAGLILVVLYLINTNLFFNSISPYILLSIQIIGAAALYAFSIYIFNGLDALGIKKKKQASI